MSNTKTLMSLIGAKIQEQKPEEAFLQDLEKTVAKLNPTKPSSTHFKPSSLNCMRLMYFDKIQAPKDIKVTDYSGVRIPETGTASHESIQHYVSKMKECGIDCEWVDVEKYVKEHNLDYLVVKNKKEFETHLLDTRYDVSFLCDGIIKYKGKYYILEIKTETEMLGMKRENADEKHRQQSVCYALCLGINDIMWLYEERNYCIPKTFHTIVTDVEKYELIEKFAIVNQAVENKVPPEKTKMKRCCNYCSYYNLCKKYK